MRENPYICTNRVGIKVFMKLVYCPIDVSYALRYNKYNIQINQTYQRLSQKNIS